MPHQYWLHDWSGWMIFHAAFCLLLLTLLVAAGVILVRGSSSKIGSETKSAVDLLNERYARGEIDREEYLLGKKDILAH